MKPRIETFVSLGFISAMSIPGTRRRISGTVAAPLMRISSPVMTVSEAGDFVSELDRADAVTTCSSKMSSALLSCADSSAAISRAVARVFAEMVSATNMSSSGSALAGSAFLATAGLAAGAGADGGCW